ncbi:dihydrofolate reductase family protein, partial [Candidatus Micrarchaeota archaeon]|nr:dihydrofolate reductase family protein [Candidatus Micrarchaeota archaeon]
MVIVGASGKFNPSRKNELEKLGVKVIVSGEEKVDLFAFLKEVAKLGINSILLEGGSELNASMLDDGLVDKFLFFVAPVIIGGKNVKGPVGGDGIREIADAYKLEFRRIRRIGKDILIEAYHLQDGNS